MSSLSLERLLFDSGNPADGPSIGSYLIGAGGNVLTETNVGADYGLDVNVINASLVVSATDFDIRSLNVATDGDHVYIMDSTGTNALDIDASGYITANINGNVTVTATDLDIRDLTHVSDSIKVGDGTDFLAVNADGSINVNLTDDGIADDAADSGNPLKVGSRGYDASSALTALSASGDRADLLSDLYRRVFVNSASNIGQAQAAVTVGTTAVQLTASPLAGRTGLIIQNNGNKSIFVGDSGVTTSDGLEVGKGGSLHLEAGEVIDLYAISTNAGQDVRIFEIG